MRARTSIVLATAVALAPLTGGAAEQQPVVFRTTSELVVVQAVVFSSGRGPVTDLTMEDFKFTENGEERPVSVFVGPDSAPLELALLVDSSGSMRSWPTKEATTALLDSLDPGSCVLLMPFADEVKPAVWGHPDAASIRTAIADLNLEGDEVIYDAFLNAFELLRARAAAQASAELSPEPAGEKFNIAELLRFRRPGTGRPDVTEPRGTCTPTTPTSSPLQSTPTVRRAIAIVTDGIDTASQATVDDVMLSAWGSRVPIFVLVLAEPRRSLRARRSFITGRRIDPRARLATFRTFKRLSEYSGGIVLSAAVDNSPEVLDGFKRIGAALRDHYLLGYVPAKTDAADAVVDRRSLEVSVRRSGFDVLAPSDLMLGRGASRGAALDVALHGFAQLATGPTANALGTFDSAATLDPGLGLAHFGRSLSLSGSQQPEAALEALVRAEQLAPWIPDLDARIAQLQVEVGDLDAAWERAVRAYRGGSDVDDLLARLQRLAPRPLDPTRLQVGRRIALQVRSKAGLLGSIMARPLLGALGTQILESEQLAFATTPTTPTTGHIVLHVDVTEAEERGQYVTLEGVLILERPDATTLENPAGKRLLVRKFRLANAESAEELRSLADAAVREIERLLATE